MWYWEYKLEIFIYLKIFLGARIIIPFLLFILLIFLNSQKLFRIYFHFYAPSSNNILKIKVWYTKIEKLCIKVSQCSLFFTQYSLFFKILYTIGKPCISVNKRRPFAHFLASKYMCECVCGGVGLRLNPS